MSEPGPPVRQPPIRTRGAAPAAGGAYLCPAVGDYPLYDEAVYQVLRQDERRNSLFRRAIAAAAPGATVLEIGAGPDLLWTLAAVDAGASRAYAVEVMGDSARRAAAAAQALAPGRVRVITGDSTQVTLPERTDLCIAEIVGCIGGSEGIAGVLADARRRHLAPGARVIPAAVRTLAAAVGLLDLMDGDVSMPAMFAPYARAIWDHVGRPFDLRLYVGNAGGAQALMSTAGVFEDLRFAARSCTQGGELRLQVTRHGRVDGLLAWIELAVAEDGDVLDSLAEDTNWLPVYIPFTRAEPLDVAPGDTLSLHVTIACPVDGIHPDYYFRGHLTRAGTATAVTAESRYSGGPFRATAVHGRLFRPG